MFRSDCSWLNDFVRLLRTRSFSWVSLGHVLMPGIRSARMEIGNLVRALGVFSQGMEINFHHVLTDAKIVGERCLDFECRLYSHSFRFLPGTRQRSNSSHREWSFVRNHSLSWVSTVEW